jgi:hypothetical protein
LIGEAVQFAASRMEAADACEMFVPSYQAIWRNMPEYFRFNIHRLTTSNVDLNFTLNLNYTTGPYVIVSPKRNRRRKNNNDARKVM